MDGDRRRRAVPERLEVAEHRPGVGVAVLGPLWPWPSRRPASIPSLTAGSNRPSGGAGSLQCCVSSSSRVSRQRTAAGRPACGTGWLPSHRRRSGGRSPGRSTARGPCNEASPAGPGLGHRQRLRVDHVPGQAEVRELDAERRPLAPATLRSSRSPSTRSRRLACRWFGMRASVDGPMDSSSRMLAGLTSRWTIPRSWGPARARATSAMISSAAGSSSRVCVVIRSLRRSCRPRTRGRGRGRCPPR